MTLKAHTITLFALSVTIGVIAGLLAGPFMGVLLAVLTLISIACYQWSSQISQEEEGRDG